VQWIDPDHAAPQVSGERQVDSGALEVCKCRRHWIIIQADDSAEFINRALVISRTGSAAFA